MDVSLKGKRAVVCGASKGIGRATALELAHLGSEVIAISRSEELLGELVEEMNVSDGQAHSYIVGDLNDPLAVSRSLGEVISASSPIHILINNSGGPKAGPLLDAELQDLADGFTSHVLAYQQLAKMLVPGMKDAGYGRIINITSTSVKQPIDSLGVSNTIRAAVANWAKSLANEVGSYGITVNNILPGYTNTERLKELVDVRSNMAGVEPKEMLKRMNQNVPAARIAEAKEIAYAVAFLAGPSASFITGSNLVVDGGKTKSL